MFGGQNFFPYQTGLASGVAKTGINWSGILSTTQKTLGVINQAIPVFYQVGPIYRNAKTAFKIMNEFRKDGSTTNQQTTNTQQNYPNTVNETPAVEPQPNYTNMQQTYNSANDPQTNRQSAGPVFFV